MDLKQIVKENPICLADEQKLRGHLTDLCPNEKAKVRIVVAIFSLGIAEEIKNSMSITEIDMERFCTRLENEGYSSKVSKECIDLWLEVYDKTIAKPEVVAPKNTTPITTTPPTPKTTLKPTSNTNIQSNTKPTPITPKASNQPRRFCFSKDGVTYVRNLDDFEIDRQGTLVKYKGNDPYVLIPDSVKKIGNGAFRENKTLTYVILPNSVTSIGDSAFWSCWKLCDITFEGNVEFIGKNAFSVSRITSIDLPNSVTTIGDFAFSYCSALEEITLPKKITTINPYTFNNCKNLKNISIPNNVTEIGFSAFSKCSNLESITIPDKVDNIHPKAFKGCKKLKTINFQSEQQKENFAKFFKRKELIVSKNQSNFNASAKTVNYKYKTKRFSLKKLAICLIALFLVAETTGLISYAKYNYALSVLEKGDYETAYVTFRELQKYKDSETYLSKFEVTYEKKVEIDSYGNETIVERNGKTVLADDLAVATEKGLQNAGKTITENHSSNGTDYINTYTYSKSGLLKKHITKSDTYGTVKHEITRTQKFDKNDNLIKSTEKSVEIISGNRDVSYKVTNTYKYNKYGDLIKETEKCTGSDSETTKYKYDKYNKLTEVEIT